MCLSEFARQHSSITHDRDGRPSTITVRAGCDKNQSNTFKLSLAPEDVLSLISLLGEYEKRERVTVAGGDDGRGNPGKGGRLTLALRALARGLCTDAPLSSSLSTPTTVPTVPTVPRTVQIAPATSTTPAQRLMAGLAANGDSSAARERSLAWL